MEKRLSDIFLPNYQDIAAEGLGSNLTRSRKLFIRGGRFSGKSFFAAHLIILSLMELASTHKDSEPWACCLALRKYSNTLKTSVYAEIANAIISLGVEDKWQMLTNPMEIRLRNTKTVIKFANLNTAEDYGKVKSIKWPGGYCRFVWFEEADQLTSKHDVDQVLLSLYRGGDIFETIFTYNTPFSPSHWLNVGWNNETIMRSENDKVRSAEQVIFRHVNLYDIPRGIVPDQVYDMAESMREDNVQEWKHVIMGEVGDPATMVFPNLKPMRDEDIDWEAKESWALASSGNWRWFIGCDYGYRPDPTAATVCGYNKIAKVLWIIDECGGIGWSEEGIYLNIAEMLSRGGGAVGKRLGGAAGVVGSTSLINSEIDNRIIDGLRSKGLNIYPIKKMSGSRDISYQFLTGGYGDLKEIWIDSEQCKAAWAEFIGAEFPRRDINGKEIIVQEFPSYNDHYIDSCRYGTYDLWSGRAIRGSSSRLL